MISASEVLSRKSKSVSLSVIRSYRHRNVETDLQYIILQSFSRKRQKILEVFPHKITNLKIPEKVTFSAVES